MSLDLTRFSGAFESVGFSDADITILESYLTELENLLHAPIATAITAEVALTDAATIAVDASLGNRFRVAVTTASHALGAPTSPTDGQKIEFIIGGNHCDTLTFNSIYRFSATIASPTLVNSKPNRIGFIYNGTDLKWDCIYANVNYA